MNPDEKLDVPPKQVTKSNYQTPNYNKQKEDIYASNVTLESDFQIFEQKVNREIVGSDLKHQWNEMMKEFDQGTKNR